MESQAPFEKELDISKLLPTLEKLALSLGDAGIAGETLNGLLESRIQLACCSCQIRVTSRELLGINLQPGAALSPKQERLKLGYCARAGCESRFYKVKCLPDTAVDWNAIWPVEEAVFQYGPVQESGPDLQEIRRTVMSGLREAYRWWLKAPLRGKIAIVVLFLLAWHWTFDFKVPGLAPKGRVFLVQDKTELDRGRATNGVQKPATGYIVRESQPQLKQ